MTEEITLIEMFSGIGGFAKGLTDAGLNITQHYFSEIDKHSIANYKYNFKNAEHIGSVTDVHNWRIRGGGKRIITFGSPCQDFSLAGTRTGLEGNKSSLITYSFEAVKRFRPDIFIWENVKGAYSSNDGADYWAIIKAFANIDGYGYETQLLNTAWFLPQNRERIYLVGHLAGKSKPGIFPFGETTELYNEARSQEPGKIASTLNANDHKSWVGNFIKQVNPCLESGGKQPYQQNRVYSTDGMSPALMSHKSDLLIKANTEKGYEPVDEGDSINLSNLSSKTRRGRVGKKRAQTLDTQCNQAVVVRALTERRTEEAKEARKKSHNKDYTSRRDKELVLRNDENANTVTANTGPEQLTYINGTIRRLTEIECERLQGFPDDWTRYGDYNGVIKPIPKTQRYKQCGNAVSVVIVKEIAKRIKLI